MPVLYNVVEKVNPRDPQGARKFYGVAQSRGEVNLRDLAEQIADISTVSTIDVMAVLEALLQVIPQHLLDGKIVRLRDFGTFRLILESNGVEKAEDFNASHIKRVKMNFRPGKEIRDALATATFEKA